MSARVITLPAEETPMEMEPIKAIIGGYFVIVGLVMVVLHKDVRIFYEDWFGTLSQHLPLMPRGRLITVGAILFGTLSIIGGGLVLLVALTIN